MGKISVALQTKLLDTLALQLQTVAYPSCLCLQQSMRRIHRLLPYYSPAIIASARARIDGVPVPSSVSASGGTGASGGPNTFSGFRL